MNILAWLLSIILPTFPITDQSHIDNELYDISDLCSSLASLKALVFLDNDQINVSDNVSAWNFFEKALKLQREIETASSSSIKVELEDKFHENMEYKAIEEIQTFVKLIKLFSQLTGHPLLQSELFENLCSRFYYYSEYRQSIDSQLLQDFEEGYQLISIEDVVKLRQSNHWNDLQNVTKECMPDNSIGH